MKFETEVTYMEKIYVLLAHSKSNNIKEVLGHTQGLMEGNIVLKACFNKNQLLQRKVYLS